MKYLINKITNHIVNNSLSSNDESLFAINGFEDIRIYAELCQSITQALNGSGKSLNIKLANRKWEYFKTKYAGSPDLHIMEQNDWVSKGASTTYYRNLHSSDILILLGTEDEDDAVGSLREILTINPENVIDLVPKSKGKICYSDIFSCAESFEQEDKDTINKLYRDLFEFMAPDLCKISNSADSWDQQITTIDDFIELFYKNLPEWGLPMKEDDLPKSRSSQFKSKANLLRQEYNFMTGVLFSPLSLSKYKTYSKKLENYEAEQRTYSSIWDGWQKQKFITNYSDYWRELLVYINGDRTPKIKKDFLYTDFSITEDVLGLKLEKKIKEVGAKIYGNPLYAFSEAILNALTECKEDDTQITKIVFRFNDATIVADDNDEDDLINQWRNICIHTNGVINYINNKMMLTLNDESVEVVCEPEDYFNITKQSKTYVNKASGNKTTNKIEFRLEYYDANDLKVAESPKKDCEWIFKCNEEWLTSFTEICNSDLAKTNSNAAIPLATNQKLKQLILSKSIDDFQLILNDESNTDFSCNILDKESHPLGFENHEMYQWFCELGVNFSQFLYELAENGLYNILLDKENKGSVDKYISSYVKLGKHILSQNINENESYILNYYIHAFNIEENDDSIKKEKNIDFCIVPPWHPASIEKIKHMSTFFADGCHEYWMAADEKGTDKKHTQEKVTELSELCMFQNAVDLFPTNGSSYFGVVKNYGFFTVYSKKDVSSENTFRDLVDKDAIYDDDFKAKSYSIMNDDALMFFNVIENYIKAFPDSKNNLSLVFIDPSDLQPIIAATHKYIEEYHSVYGDNEPLSIALRVLVKPENMGGKNYLSYWMNETFDLDSNVKIKTYLNVWNDKEELENYLNANNDIVFVMELLKTNEYGFIKNLDAYKPSNSECYFPIVFRPGVISISSTNKRRIELTQPQFAASAIHTQIVHHIKHLELDSNDESYYAVKNVNIDNEGQEIVRDLHKKAYWVVCIDSGMDGALLKNDASATKDYSVIGFSTGKGKFGQYNLTVTARPTIVESIKNRFSDRLYKMFHWNNEQIEKASTVCMNEASYLDGISVLRASNRNDYNINEFMAYVLTSLREKESGTESPLKTIVHLDSYKHWFSGRGETKTIFDGEVNKSRPDFLILELDKDYTDKIKIKAKIVECKISGIINKNEHIEKAVGQVRHGVEVLREIFDPLSKSLKRRYWYAQLYRALAFAQVTFTNTSQEFKEVSEKLRKILDGEFEIEWSSEILGYWVDLQGNIDTKESINEVDIYNIPQNRIQKLLLGESSENIKYSSDIDVALFDDEEEEIKKVRQKEESIKEEFENQQNKEKEHTITKKNEEVERVDFSLDEAIILLSFVLKIKDNKISVDDAANELSKILKDIAKDKGIIVSESFRSPVGLKGRFDAMKTALGDETGTRTTKVFEDAVNIYKNENEKYKEIISNFIPNDESEEQVVDEVDKQEEVVTSSDEHVEEPVSYVNEQTRVLVGKDKARNQVYWEFGHKQLANRHLLITGTSGQGKTYGIQTLLYELSKTNVSSVIFDYTEGFREDQLEPKFNEKMKGSVNSQIIYNTGVPINPFKRHEITVAGIQMIEKPSDVASRIANIFTHVYNFGEQQASAIFNAARNGLNKYKEEMNMDYFRDELEKMKSVNPAAKTVISKMEPFFYSIEFLDDTSFNWDEILYGDHSKVTIFQLTQIDRSIQVIITELMLWDAWYYTQKVGSKDKPFVVVLDEAQNLSHKENSPSAKILTEGRKFGWSAWFATQSLKILSDEEVVRLMQASFKLYFKPTEDEITKIAKQIDPSDSNTWVSPIKNLNKGQCIAVGDRIRNDGSFGNVKPAIVSVDSFEERN